MALFRDLIFCIFSTDFFEIFLLFLAIMKGILIFFLEFMSLTRLMYFIVVVVPVVVLSKIKYERSISLLFR